MLLRHTTVALPPDLRPRLENARLDLLALFRALDRMDLSPAEIPQQLLRQLFELDADYGEALWALDQPPGKLNQHAMLRDTLAALEQLPQRLIKFRNLLPPRAQRTLPSSFRFADHCILARRTTWCRVETPKSVKHPLPSQIVISGAR